MPAAQAAAPSASTQSRGRKEYPALMRYVVIAMLVLIVASLFSAAVFMVRDQSGSGSKRMVKALALRVGLSVALFAALMAGYYFGVVPGRL